MKQHPITEADLHAYIDGVLPPSRCAEIEAYLAHRPEEAKRLQAYQQQKHALRALFNPVMHEPIPPSIPARPLYRPWNVQSFAAGLLIAAASGTAGWLLHGQAASGLSPSSPAARQAANDRAPALARQAAIAHVVYSPSVRHPVEIGADQKINRSPGCPSGSARRSGRLNSASWATS